VSHVTLHVWRVPAPRLTRVLWRMALDRGRLRRAPGVRFVKLLGTGRGRRFGPSRADPTRWAALVVWDDAGGAESFDATRTAGSWRALATSYCRLDLRPLASRGTWAGREPFTPTEPFTTTQPFTPTEPFSPTQPFTPSEPFTPTEKAVTDGPVLALTRARLRSTRAVTFWRAIGPVAAAVTVAPGLLATFAIGEAPIGWQGTVSLWRRASDLVEFAYHHRDHRRVIERTPAEGWYAEELFARFAVLEVTGDRDLIGWAEERTVPQAMRPEQR